MKELCDRLQIHLAALDSRVTTVEGSAGSLARLAETVLAAPAATVDFPNIPQTYTHLRIALAGRGDAALIGVELNMTINGVVTATYDRQRVYGTGATASGTELLAQTAIAVANLPGANALANLYGIADVMIMDYTQVRPTPVMATFYRKSSNSAGDSIIGVYGGTARSQAAVSRITLAPNTGNFVAGSRFTLYGMK
jgi:hypothetical protein